MRAETGVSVPSLVHRGRWRVERSMVEHEWMAGCGVSLERRCRVCERHARSVGEGRSRFGAGCASQDDRAGAVRHRHRSRSHDDEDSRTRDGDDRGAPVDAPSRPQRVANNGVRGYGRRRCSIVDRHRSADADDDLREGARARRARAANRVRRNRSNESAGAVRAEVCRPSDRKIRAVDRHTTSRRMRGECFRVGTSRFFARAIV